MKLFKFPKLKQFGSYFIELIIVVLGVTIAFQLNVWNDNRKTKDVEKQLIENFAAENNYNIRESDSSLFYKNASIETGVAFMTLLKNPESSTDSVRYYLARLYEITWPNFATTHLENYLNFTTGSTPLREEILNLKSLIESIHVLGDSYSQQKQMKYFDYLSDAVDMADNLTIINRGKIFSAQFRNNLMFIIAYEQSMAEVLEEIALSQLKLDSLINSKEN